MRGKADIYGYTAYVVGITPAHAGKRSVLSADKICSGDHPRTCGEKYYPLLPVYQCGGSPPHMRGKAPEGIHTQISARITPAHAGKSFTAFVKIIISGDHPRTCGEKLLVYL